MDKRHRNVRAALEKVIDKAGDVEVNAAPSLNDCDTLIAIITQLLGGAVAPRWLRA